MKRLFQLYGAALTCAVLTALLVPLGVLARDLAQDRAMTAARQQTQGLAVLAGPGAVSQLRDAVQALNQGDLRTSVFLPDGRQLGAPSPRSPSVDLAARGLAFTATTGGGRELLVPVAGGQGVTVIRTFVPGAALTAGVPMVWATLAGVGLFLLAASSLVGAVVARRLSVSITTLATTARRIGAGDLEATVHPSGPPEVVAVGGVLNDLGARVRTMLQEERELSADLSHRLRTPVTALRLDAESLADPAERTLMAGHAEALVAAVDEAVAAARQGRGADPGACDADQVVRLRGAFWSVLARETRRPFTLDSPGHGVLVAVSASRLGAAIDALLDNVLRHTPDGTGFGLSLTDEGHRCRVAVTDHGPGMAPEQSARGVSGSGSTGIGMDVARRAAQAAHGELTVTSCPGSGTRVVLTLPASWRNLNSAQQQA